MNYVPLQMAFPASYYSSGIKPEPESSKECGENIDCSQMIAHLKDCPRCKLKLKHLISEEVSTTPNENRPWWDMIDDTKKLLMVIAGFVCLVFILNILFSFEFTISNKLRMNTT